MPVSTFTRAGQWGPEGLIDAVGDAQVGAAVALYHQDGTTLATRYADAAKTPAANPWTSDAIGNVTVFADPGQYVLKVTIGGLVTPLPIEVPVDPTEAALDADVTAEATTRAASDAAHAAAVTGVHGVAVSTVESAAGAQAKADAAQAAAEAASDPSGAAAAAQAYAVQRAHHTGTQAAATVLDFDTQVRASRLDQMAAPTGDVTMAGFGITDLRDPTAAQEAATKAYADGLVGTTGPLRTPTGADPTGVADSLAAFQAVDGLGYIVVVGPGTFRIASTATLAGTYLWSPGAVLKPDAGVTVTFSGQIQAGAQRIFDVTSAGAAINVTGYARRLLPEWWGAKGDWRQVTDGAVDPAADATLLTSATAAFTATEVGKGIGMTSIVAGVPVWTCSGLITSYVSATQAHFSALVTEERFADATYSNATANTIDVTSPTLNATSADVGRSVIGIGGSGSLGGGTHTVTALLSPTSVRVTCTSGTPDASGNPLLFCVVGRPQPIAARTGMTVQVWTDDRAAIKACMASTATLPVVELRGVTYAVGPDGSQSYSLTVPYSGMRFEGVKGKTWLKHPMGMSRGGGLDVMDIVSVDYTTFRGVGFDGNWGNPSVDGKWGSAGMVDSRSGINHLSQADPKNDCVKVRNAKQTLFENCLFRQAHGDFVWIGATNGSTVANAVATAPYNTTLAWCDGDMANRDGVTIGGAADGVLMSHCHWVNVFIQSLDTEPVSGFSFARRVHADHCTFGGWWNQENPSLQTQNVVTIVGSGDKNAGPTNYAFGFRLTSCTVYGGVDIVDGFDVTVRDCTIITNFNGYSYAPVRVSEYADNIRILDNWIYDRSAPSSAGSPPPSGTSPSTHDAAIQIVRANDTASLIPQGVQVGGNRVYARNGRMGIAVEGQGGTAGYSGTASDVTATTVTDSGAVWTTDQFVTHDVIIGTAIGKISGNTGTVLTIVSWTDALGNVVATPAAGGYRVLANSGMVDIYDNFVDCTDDGWGAGGEGILIYPRQGNLRARVRHNTVRNPTGSGIDVKQQDATRLIAYLALLDNHVYDDQVTPTATAAINFQQANLNFVTQLLMRGNTQGVGVPALVTGLTSGYWRTGGSSAPTFEGFGSPEGVVTAPIGSTFQRLDGTPGATIYRKETGTGNTGWAVSTTPLNTATFTFQGPLAVAAGQARFYVEVACVISTVRVSVGTAPTGAAVIVDVNKNGTTIYTTQANRPTVAISGFTATANSPDVTALAAGDYLTVDIDQIGSTITGSDLTVEVRVTG